MINPKVDEEIFDAILTQALKENNENYLNKLPSENRLSKELEFSDKFNKKMNKLIREYKNRIIKENTFVYGKRIVAGILIIAGLGFGALMLSEPVRATIQNIIIQWFDEYTQFDFQSDTSEVEFKEFTLGYLPEGFEEIDYFLSTGLASIEYEDLQGNDILFEYSIAEDLSLALDNEHSSYNIISINDSEAHLFESNDDSRRSYLLWIDKGYTFTIGSNIDVDEIIKIAENIKIK